MPKRRPVQTKREEKEIFVHCPECRELLWSDAVFVFCKTPGCGFSPDDLLEFWISKHAENSDVEEEKPECRT